MAQFSHIPEISVQLAKLNQLNNSIKIGHQEKEDAEYTIRSAQQQRASLSQRLDKLAQEKEVIEQGLVALMQGYLKEVTLRPLAATGNQIIYPVMNAVIAVEEEEL